MINPHGICQVEPSNHGIVTVSEMENILSHSALVSLVIKLAITLGAIKIDEAKITGITPAELSLIGRKLAFAIEAV